MSEPQRAGPVRRLSSPAEREMARLCRCGHSAADHADTLDEHCEKCDCEQFDGSGAPG